MFDKTGALAVRIMFRPRFTQPDSESEIVSFEFLLERGHGLSCFRNLGFKFADSESDMMPELPVTVTVTVTSKLILVYL
jgi:hypothetical protein